MSSVAECINIFTKLPFVSVPVSNAEKSVLDLVEMVLEINPFNSVYLYPRKIRLIKVLDIVFVLPVLGCPVRSSQLSGLDSLLSIVQMPKGVAVGTLAIGEAGAANAGLLAAQIVALQNKEVRDNIIAFRSKQTETVLANQTLEL